MVSDACRFSLASDRNQHRVNSKLMLAVNGQSGNNTQMPLPTTDSLTGSVRFEQSILDLLGLDAGRLPLGDHCIYRGSDFDRAGKAVSSVSEPRTFEALCSEPTPCIELRRARLRYSEIALTFNNVDTRMRTQRRIDYYSLAIPLSGSQVSITDAGEVTTRPPHARLHSAGSVYDIRRSANYVAIIVGLSLAGFERFVGDKIDFLIPPDGSFSLLLDMSDESFAVFTSILSALLKALGERGNDAPQSDIVITRLEEALWFAFADACPELYREYKQARREGVRSSTVKRVTQFMHDSVHQELMMTDLVGNSGVSARTLYAGFSQAYGIGPMAYLKRLKLIRCRENLIAADSETEFVGDIAADWGFYHLSSFARYYRREFGELPSETLKRNK